MRSEMRRSHSRAVAGWCQRVACGFTLASIGVILSYANTVFAAPVKPTSCTATISACGCTITKSGVYTVSADLNSSQGLNPDGDCLDIKVSKVTLNLGSHSITGPGGMTTDIGIQDLHSSNNDNIVGSQALAKISGWATGVQLRGNAIVLSSVDASSNKLDGIELNGSSNDHVANWTANNEGSIGLWIKLGSNNFVTHGNANSNDDTGILVGCVNGGVAGEDCTGAKGASKGNDIVDDSTLSNSKYGVALESNASGTLVNSVSASGNTTDDLLDATGGCGSNEWVDDSFTTHSENCID